MSDYGVGKTKNWFTTQACLNGIGAFALGLAFVQYDDFTFKTTAIILLLLLGMGRVLIIFFPTDLGGTKKTHTGRIHYLLAIVNFTLAYVVINNVTPVLRGLEQWQSIAALLTILEVFATVGIIAVVMALLIKPLRRVFGVSERLFLFSIGLWFIVVSAYVIR